MNETRMKNLSIEIRRLRSKRDRLESEALHTASRIGGVPSGGLSDKVGKCAAELAELDKRITELELERLEGFNRLSREVFEENCYYLKYKLHMSWRKIAVLTTKRPDTDEAIRKAVRRYFKNFEW